MTYVRALVGFSLVLGGCSDVIDLDPLDTTPPVEASVRPAPILGGTLTMMGTTAIAADPDRDLIHVVDVPGRKVLHTIALEAGDQPGRVVLGADGRAHVVLRGFGGIATIDPAAGAVIARQQLCAEPRGLAFHDLDASLYVACAGGTLFHLDNDGAEIERIELEPDLRDVLIVGDEVKVSLFRSAVILGLDGSRVAIPGTLDRVAHVAWRAWANDNGGISMIHQLESTEPVPINPDPEDLPEGGSPYGGGGFCEEGLVSAAFSTITDGTVSTVVMPDSRLTVDAAVSLDGAWLAMAVPGAVKPEPVKEKGGHRRNFDFDFGIPATGATVRIERTDGPDCFPMIADEVPGQVTAVAFDTGGRLVMQSREPARLLIMDSVPFGAITTIELEGEPRFDTGHEIFHRATESGLSCASCHPEGTDDGHVWTFDGLGPRRTQALDVGLADTAPFHWDGDMPDFNVLMSEVLAHRMGGKRQSPARGDSFTRWLFSQQRPPAQSGPADLTLASTGEALFATYACTKCHDGPALGGSRTERISGEDKQVPTLRRVSLHPPFMHDGRSKTLEAAVRNMIETTTEMSAPAADIDAIAAFLRTL